MEVFKAIQDRKVLLVIFLLKQSRGTALFLLLLGIVGIIASLYGFFFTMFFGINF